MSIIKKVKDKLSTKKAVPKPEAKSHDNVKLGEPLFEFYEKLHFRELDERDKLNSKFQIFVTAAVALLGYLLHLLNSSSPFPISNLPVYALFCLQAFGYVLISGCYFIRSYWGNTYSVFSTPSDLESHRAELVNYDNQYEQDISERNFNTAIREQLVRISTKNAKVNNERAERVHSGNYFLIVAIIFTLIASISFWFSDSKIKPDNGKIVIIQQRPIEGNASNVRPKADNPTIPDNSSPTEPASGEAYKRGHDTPPDGKEVGSTVTNKNPPPPPPPKAPPERDIREEVPKRPVQ